MIMRKIMAFDCCLVLFPTTDGLDGGSWNRHRRFGTRLPFNVLITHPYPYDKFLSYHSHQPRTLICGPRAAPTDVRDVSKLGRKKKTFKRTRAKERMGSGADQPLIGNVQPMTNERKALFGVGRALGGCASGRIVCFPLFYFDDAPTNNMARSNPIEELLACFSFYISCSLLSTCRPESISILLYQLCIG